MHCQNLCCMAPAIERKKFADPRRGKGDELVYVTRYICSQACEEGIVNQLEKEANYARLVS